WIPFGPIQWGVPVTIPITNPAETDMPHSTTSLWQFRVVGESILDTTLVFDSQVKIYRGPADIPLWPGHPDFYAKGHWRVVQPEINAVTRDYGQLNYNGLQQSEVTSVRPEKLISYGTQTLYVYVNITAYEGRPGASPDHWYLYFHNASGGWNITTLNDANNTVGPVPHDLLFILKVDPNGMDTPYAPSSRWEFQLRGTLNAGGLGCYLDCADYEVEYRMTILATDLKPDRPYTCGGVGEDVCPT
ncbi:MAG TPA: hypothetical protein VNZ52_03285, partial [Candidatus Thermoplasmatota archaeon]|nr:hypothetical protein [Candidatus Thermoplasmatota archaeon]